MKLFGRLVFLLLGVTSAVPTPAYEHTDSLVEFEEYSERVVADARQRNKPYFLLFSAEWCHWCHEFAEHTLVRRDVADYLNRNFVNVFIDVDIHNSAYVKYRATGLPYTVFLNPDGTIYYKYTGTLYGDDFLDVIKEVAAEAGPGKYALGMEASHVSYTPPDEMAADVGAMPDIFRAGVVENFDAEEYGLGKGQKAILPRTFLYLLQSRQEDDPQVVGAIVNTLERAIDRIYDAEEGGFFRYAETRDWQVPHFEKFADLNAGAVLLLCRLHEVSPSTRLKEAAERTVDYLTSTLFDSETGSFLSFQIADSAYYYLNAQRRKSVQPPKVMDKIFTDRLAVTLDYLIDVIDCAENADLTHKVRRSLDFLADMILGEEGVARYYSVPAGRWLQQGGLSDYAYLGGLFSKAASRFPGTDYADVALELVRTALTRYYHGDARIFIDPTVDSSINVEYLMEINGLFAQTLLALDHRLDGAHRPVVESLLAYFSLMGEVLEDRLWDARDWEFTETYVPYLRAYEQYTAIQTSSAGAHPSAIIVVENRP